MDDVPTNDYPGQPIGQAIKAWRKIRELKQQELARKIGMSAAQLCHIEKSRNTPSIRTLRRIAEALDVSLSELTAPEPLSRETPSFPLSFQALREEHAVLNEVSSPVLSYSCKEEPAFHMKSLAHREASTGFLFVHDPADFPIAQRFHRTMTAKVRSYLKLEQATGVPVQPSFSFLYPAGVGEGQSETLARMVRTSCGIGPAVSFDSIAFFESKGIRVVVMDLPPEWSSWSLYDDQADNAVIFLQKKMAEEHRQFRMASEIAHVIRFATNGLSPLHDSAEERRFAREFASAFLMPEEVLRETAYRLRRNPSNWSLPLLLQVKQRYGVTAEVLAYRLESLGLLAPSLRASFLSQLREYYKSHDRQEPCPANRQLLRHSRFSDLKLLEKTSDQE